MAVPPAIKSCKTLHYGPCGRCGRYSVGSCDRKSSSWPPSSLPVWAIAIQSRLERRSNRGFGPRRPEGPNLVLRPSNRLVHTEVRQAGPSIVDPGPKLLTTPRPPVGVSILRGSRASAQAHLYAHVQHIVVDLEKPRSLRPTIGWPASGAMHHPAYQLRRIHLLRTPVNRATIKRRKGSTACPVSPGDHLVGPRSLGSSVPLIKRGFVPKSSPSSANACYAAR
jgi:hypothetical protein